MPRFQQKRHKLEPLIPTVIPSKEVYDESLKTMGMKTEDVTKFLDSYDETIINLLRKYDAPLLRYMLAPDSFTAIMQQISDLQHGMLRSPLILGYVAKDEKQMYYALIATLKRGSGDGSGDATTTFIRKKHRADIELYDPDKNIWEAQPNITKIYQLQHKGNAGKELVAGICELFDNDIFNIDPGVFAVMANKYGRLCTLCDNLKGLGKIQLMVLESNGKNNNAENRYFPILVASNGKIHGTAVAEKNGVFYLLQYKEGFRFSKNMTIMWGNSFIDNDEFSHTVYTTQNPDDIILLLQSMWKRKPTGKYYFVFPLSNKTSAEVIDSKYSLLSLDHAEATEEENENLMVGMKLMLNSNPYHNFPKKQTDD